MNQVLIDTDQSLCSVRDYGRDGNDERDQRHRGCAASHPHQNQRSNRDDGYGLQQDRIRVEHSAHPPRLREDKRDNHADYDAGNQAGAGLHHGDGRCGQ